MSFKFLARLFVFLAVLFVSDAMAQMQTNCTSANYYNNSFHPGCLSWTDLNKSFAQPPPIGNQIPNTGSFSTLSVSNGGTLNGTFGGNPTFSGTFTYTNLAVANNATIGGTLGVALQASFTKPSGNGINVTAGALIGGVLNVGGLLSGAAAAFTQVDSSGKIQAVNFTTGLNNHPISSTAFPNLLLVGGNVSGTVVGAGAWGGVGVASDTADYTAASDRVGKLWELQSNITGSANGGRVGLWAQLNPSNLTHTMELITVNGQIAIDSDAAGSFFQPISGTVEVKAGALNVGNTLNEFIVSSKANVVGIKGVMQITIGRGDLYQGITADAGLFFANANAVADGSPGFQAAIAFGNTSQAIPIGPTGTFITMLLQTADQGNGKNGRFIPPQGFGGIDLQYLNTTIASGFSYRGAGFKVDGTGQVLAAQGLLLGRSGTNYTIDAPNTFAVNSVVPNVAGSPTVSAGSSRGNYYPGDIVHGSGSPAGQYLVTSTKVVSAAITTAGSGGTPGSQVLTVSGGAGSGATITVTVSGGGVVTSVNSISSGGAYTINPSNLNAASVTGGGFSVFPTFAIGLGANALSVLVPDQFVTNVTAITTVGGSGAGLTLTATNQVRAGLSVMPTAGGLLGFYGTTPVAKQTGVAVTAAGIHAALTSLGLIAP